MEEQTIRQYIVGQRVSTQVEKIFPYGIFVQLGEGQRAYIRRRELSLAGDLEPEKIVQLGQTIDAVVQELPRVGQMMELSHKASLPNPWASFMRTAQIGDVVEGSVKDVRPYGIFVEIVPGVDGFVPTSELTTWPVDETEKMFWRGDCVAAVIISIDRQQRKMRLSIRRHLEQLARVAQIIDRLDQHADHQSSVALEATQSPLPLVPVTEDGELTYVVSPAESENVGRILVVEDCAEICGPLVLWLCHRGYAADAAHSAEEARQKLRQSTYGLLLIDIDLAEINGLVLIEQMQQTIGNTRVIVMSTAANLEEYTGKIEALGVVGTFVKPLDLIEIEQLLSKIGRGEPLPIQRSSAVLAQATTLKPLHEFATTLNVDNSLAGRLHGYLAQLVKSVGAEEGIIFYKDPVAQSISMLAQVGILPLTEAASYTLNESPVNDVIQAQGVIFEHRMVTQTEEQFRNLLGLLTFRSCIGLPIATDRTTQHALFLFHRRANAFHRYHVRETVATANLCAAFIERTRFNTHMASLNKLLLSGQLAASFGHEIFNKLSGLEIQLWNLQSNSENLAQHVPLLMDEVSLPPLKRDLDSLLETAKNLRLMVEDFQQLMRAENEEALDVCATLRGVIIQLRPIAHKNNIKLKFDCPLELPCVMGSRMRLQQVLFNLMLNGIQQMAATLQTHKMVQVTAAYVASDQTRPIKIRVTDNGPGIHKQQWEKIFDLGFTTRRDGSGLGLFIAQSLVEALGGKLGVERSRIALGTTFFVELPALTQTKEVV